MPVSVQLDDLTNVVFMTTKTVTSHRDDSHKPLLIFSKMIIHGQFWGLKILGGQFFTFVSHNLQFM